MNQFRVIGTRTDDFERAWKERDSFLEGFAGFREFQLLRGPVVDGGIQRYASHTVWDNEDAFREWLESDAFKKAHAHGKLTGILAGPPEFVGWTSVPMK